MKTNRKKKEAKRKKWKEETDDRFMKSKDLGDREAATIGRPAAKLIEARDLFFYMIAVVNLLTNYIRTWAEKVKRPVNNVNEAKFIHSLLFSFPFILTAS